MGRSKVGIITGAIAVVIIAIILVVVLFFNNNQPSSNEGSVPAQTTQSTQPNTFDIHIEDNTDPVSATEEATEEGTYDKSADVELKLVDGRDDSEVSANNNNNNNENSNISASRIK